MQGELTQQSCCMQVYNDTHCSAGSAILLALCELQALALLRGLLASPPRKLTQYTYSECYVRPLHAYHIGCHDHLYEKQSISRAAGVALVSKFAADALIGRQDFLSV